MKAPRADVVLFGVTCVWSSTFIITKALLEDAPPLLYLALRFGVAALIFLPLVAWRGLPAWGKDARGFLRDGLVIGLLNATGLLFQVAGQLYTTPAKSAFVTSLNTPLTAVVALVAYRELPSRAQRVAILLATFGLFLLTWPSTGARFNPGDLLTVGCACLYAGFIVESARRGPRHDAFSLTVVLVLIGALLFAICAAAAHLLLARSAPSSWSALLRLEARPFPLGTTALVQMAYMSIVCVVLVMLAQTWALRRLSATTSAVIYSTEPVIATGLAVLVHGASEWPGPRGVAGGILVLCAVYATEGEALRRLRRTRQNPANTINGAASGKPTGEDPATEDPAAEQPEALGPQ